MIKSPKLLGLGPYFSRGFVWNEVTRAPSLLFPQPSKELWLAFPGSPLMQRGLTAGSSPTHPSLTHPPSEWSPALYTPVSSSLISSSLSVIASFPTHPPRPIITSFLPGLMFSTHFIKRLFSARHLVLFLPPLSLQSPWLPISFVPSDSVYFPITSVLNPLPPLNYKFY